MKKVKVERMKELCLNKAYSCGGEIYKFLNGDYLPSMLDKITDGTIKLTSNLAYGKDVITHEEKFLGNLDKYIGYVRDHYHIDHIEQDMLIELSLTNKYSEILYCLDDFHKNQNYTKFFDGYRKMFLYYFYDNIVYYSNYVDNNSPINKLLNKIKSYSFDNDEDIIEIEKVLIPIINNRKDNIYQSCIPHNEIEELKYNFYINQIEWIISDYYEKGIYDFEINSKDNYITIDSGTKILFNILEFKKIKKEYIIRFGIKNHYFRADKIITFKEKELKDLLKRMSKNDISKRYDTEYSFIDSTLRFNFWNQEKIQFLDIRFEFCEDNDDAIKIGLDPIDTKELYILINHQLCNKK